MNCLDGGEMMKVLMIGGAGFIGEHLARYLVNKGVGVTVVDLNVGTVPQVNYVKHNITRTLPIHELMQADIVLYMAAITSAECDKTPELAVDVHTNCAIQTAKLVDKMIYFGTAAIYKRGRVRETPTHLKIDSLYKATKYLGEVVTLALAKLPVVVRLTNVYGPGKREDKFSSIETRILLNALQDEPLTIYSPHSGRDFIYVSDVCEAIWAVITNYDSLVGHVWNISTDKLTTLGELADIVQNIHNKPLTISYTTDLIVGDKLVLDFQKFRFVTGWTPKISVETGMRKYYNWRKEVMQ